MLLPFLFLSQLNHLQILELALVDSEADESAYLVETLNPSSARIDVEHVQGLVVLHL